MAPRTVEFVAIGPAPLDPYSPLAAVWSVARSAAERGDRVRVLYPEGPTGAAPPDGVTAEPVPFALRRPGTMLEDADFASAAGRRIRPDAELILRDPSGLGPLGVGGRQGRSLRLAAFVRSVGVHEFDRERTGTPAGGLADRIGSWRDRRAIRRLEHAALDEADLLLCESAAIAEALVAEYGVARSRLRAAPSPVPMLPDAPSRASARGSLGIPPDVPTIVAPVAPEAAEGPGTEGIREAFRRIRPLFPGVRLVVAGATCPNEPGLVSVPGREATSFATALAAGDVALIAPRHRGFDPGVVFAQRAGCATIATPSIEFPVPPGSSVRPTVSDEAGDIASVLAELVADPAACRELAASGREYSRRFDPGLLLLEMESTRAAAR